VTKSGRVVGGTCSVDGEMKKNTYIILPEKSEWRHLKERRPACWWEDSSVLA
jgi:hypothetical protein